MLLKTQRNPAARRFVNGPVCACCRKATRAGELLVAQFHRRIYRAREIYSIYRKKIRLIAIFPSVDGRLPSLGRPLAVFEKTTRRTGAATQAAALCESRGASPVVADPRSRSDPLRGTRAPRRLSQPRPSTPSRLRSVETAEEEGAGIFGKWLFLAEDELLWILFDRTERLVDLIQRFAAIARERLILAQSGTR